MYAKKNSGKKVFAMLLALALVVGCGIGGTIAWLMDTTDAVTNTFTVGDVELTLVESPYDAANGTYGTATEKVNNQYPLIPGNTYMKDPKVTVLKNSEDCYLFVKLEKVNDPDTYLTYEFEATGWTSYAAATDTDTLVYYREVTKSDADQAWELLKKDASNITVTVKETIVKNNTTNTTAPVMPASTNQPQLIFTAYAVQKANVADAAAAWAILFPPATT